MLIVDNKNSSFEFLKEEFLFFDWLTNMIKIPKYFLKTGLLIFDKKMVKIALNITKKEEKYLTKEYNYYYK